MRNRFRVMQRLLPLLLLAGLCVFPVAPTQAQDRTRGLFLSGSLSGAHIACDMAFEFTVARLSVGLSWFPFR